MDKATVERIAARAVLASGGCLNWTGATNPAGYGNIFVAGKYRNAHRAMWVAVHGEIPRELVVCHRCDNPRCVNIKHLFVGRQFDNMTDMSAKGRRAIGSSQGEKISAGWTPELRAQRALQTEQRMHEAREAKRKAAGANDETKFCPGCQQWLAFTLFHKNAARLDGLKPYCKPCSLKRDAHRVKSKAAETA